ncbi:MAG TPA: hypothetical protein DD379_09515 [Cyanobacteria bacterium UBA11162]|nr:hypothetical protein [Cyanobacteria bacterium UBA11162]
MPASSWHQGWDITEEKREVYRKRSQASSKAKAQALRGEGKKPIHPINVPQLNPEFLMPKLAGNGLRSLSLFSGGGGLDLGFDQANGVAGNREQAHLFVPENGHFRLSVPDCAILQGFPDFWQIHGAVYMALGQIGNAVPPPMSYRVAVSIAQALS